jgi:hypothetical protein
MKKIQIFGNPVIHTALTDKLKSDFTDCEISTTEQEILPQQDFYFVSISAYLACAHVAGKPIVEILTPIQNRIAFLKASDTEWENEVKVTVIHKNNYLKINDIITSIVEDDGIIVP